MTENTHTYLTNPKLNTWSVTQPTGSPAREKKTKKKSTAGILRNFNLPRSPQRDYFHEERSFFIFNNTSISPLCNLRDQGEDPIFAWSAHGRTHAFTGGLEVFSKTWLTQDKYVLWVCGQWTVSPRALALSREESHVCETLLLPSGSTSEVNCGEGLYRKC